MAACFPALAHPLPLAIAHRGGALEAEENTTEAFAHAAALGYRFIETDVRVTRDGVAVLHHDATLARMCGRPEAVADLTWAALSEVRTRGGAAIPRLDAVLADLADMRFVLEAKSDDAVPAMAAAIRSAGAVGRVCVGAFSPARTARLRAALGPDLAWSPAHLGVARVWLAGCGLPVAMPGCAAIQVPVRFRGVPVVTRGLLRAARRAGMQVHVWTVDAPDEMARLLDLGVHGIITDRPTVLRRVLTDRDQWTGGPTNGAPRIRTPGSAPDSSSHG
ncbi:glycerophosphodiester phosphodiesterase family protein [Rhodobaculum claviforme]|uniref:GP-PDE domain-containing protein n=1 Tax=Rhodobaculum claviforme TaxID=1549854 RepID=A0A934TNE9_9RHOB|nr:glycerophosphodiester phosphodiesterase family protein [Rhodobaculum claviforme]MBK5928806.1 hypothetical protein [Rhodobaculum claviforme]